MSKELEPFGDGEMEPPSHEARMLADARHYEALTRINTLCEAGKAGVDAVVKTHLKIVEEYEKNQLPRAVANELWGLEAEVYQTARAIIKHLDYQ